MKGFLGPLPNRNNLGKFFRWAFSLTNKWGCSEYKSDGPKLISFDFNDILNESSDVHQVLQVVTSFGPISRDLFQGWKRDTWPPNLSKSKGHDLKMLTSGIYDLKSWIKSAEILYVSSHLYTLKNQLLWVGMHQGTIKMEYIFHYPKDHWTLKGLASFWGPIYEPLRFFRFVHPSVGGSFRSLGMFQLQVWWIWSGKKNHGFNQQKYDTSGLIRTTFGAGRKISNRYSLSQLDHQQKSLLVWII